MHQHVETKLLLLLHHDADFFTHLVEVIQMTDFTALVGGTRLADFRSLRERADGGGRERRQLPLGLLLGDALGKTGRALGINRGHRRQALLHQRIMDAAGAAAAGLGGARSDELRFHFGCLAIQCQLEGDDFSQFLGRERQPAFQFVVELGFVSQVHRHVQ